MFANFIKWRYDYQVDTVLETFEMPELDEVRKYYPFNFHGVDKQGHPVAIELVGPLDIAKLLETTTVERMLTLHRKMHEEAIKLRFPACS